MPIKFRCPHCHQFLGISRAKAGEISDCPMCGKTVRVPDLDGTVQPLPSPELNLEDSDLVDALGELASIGAEQASGHTRSTPKSSATVATAHVPAPEPVQLAPLKPAIPVVVADPPTPSRPAGRRSESAPSSGQKQDSPEERPQIAADAGRASTQQRSRRTSQSRGAVRRSLPFGWIAVATIAGALLAGSVGMFVMPRDTTTAAGSVDPTSPQVSEPAVASPTPDSADAAIPALTGRITYVSEAGDTRPDDGARVIVLPAQRRGTIKFDAAGFMAGSGEVDAAVASAALQALGGDLAIADEQGEYAVNLNDAGSYELVVISRHQSRPWEVGVEATTQEMLERFFIRPSTLLGQLAYVVQPFQYRAQGTSPKDFAFERQ